MKGNKTVDIDNLIISNEIVFEILKRICAKSLMRFRCVSKYFCSLISESSFIVAHHKSSAAQFLLHRVTYTPKIVIYNLSLEDGDLANCLVRYLDETCFRTLHNMQSSSINGIFCLWNYNGDVAICNPFIKDHVFLPKVPDIEKVSQSIIISSYLFGFDSTANKHKVLMGYMVFFENRLVHGIKYLIFTIGVDKSWRDISGGWMPNICTTNNYVCIDGVIYCENRFRPNIVVISIVREKLIRTISFPDERVLILPGMMNTIVEIKGQVALVVNGKDDVDEGFSKICVYILNGTSETEAWVKHIIELPSLSTTTSLFTTNHKGEIVWIPDTKTLHMFLYDIGLKEWRKVEIHGNYEQQCITDPYSVLLYLVESIRPLR
ncbi:hypothetical protein H5410_009563 [Solanum commersonii]|uniref:F-box domain-containing protein n=1 Tax=Solanum commersonii TaxID=4109 RepID=A0A9J6AIS6_SOLCO|nr:hypothetical protein H5410_009563 [Solanum commersonii]